jgi:hypothetical protein
MWNPINSISPSPLAVLLSGEGWAARQLCEVLEKNSCVCGSAFTVNS